MTSCRAPWIGAEACECPAHRPGGDINLLSQEDRELIEYREFIDATNPGTTRSAK